MPHSPSHRISNDRLIGASTGHAGIDGVGVREGVGVLVGEGVGVFVGVGVGLTFSHPIFSILRHIKPVSVQVTVILNDP